MDADSQSDGDAETGTEKKVATVPKKRNGGTAVSDIAQKILSRDKIMSMVEN